MARGDGEETNGNATGRWYRYPRTPHLPSSPGASADDRILADTTQFEHRRIVVSLKLDGESTTLYRDHLHARSPDSAHHPSRSWVKQLHARIAAEIPPGWRICGENLYARHAIAYRELPSFLFVYSIWNERNEALAWGETLEWCSLLELEPVPVFYRDEWPGEDELTRIAQAQTPWSDVNEGYVVRVEEGFAYDEFGLHVAKWVRANHVPGQAVHWRTAQIMPNTLAGS